MSQVDRLSSEPQNGLVEIMYSLPQEFRAEIVESAEQYLATQRQVEQLRLALGLEEDSTTRREEETGGSYGDPPQRGRRMIAFGWYGGKYSHLT